MDKNLDIILNFRKFILQKIEHLTDAQLNFVPENHSNNIIWNIAHLNAVLQALCYRSSGLPITIDNAFFIPFLPGTKPEAQLDADLIATIKKQFIDAVYQLNEDLSKGIFTSYHPIEKIRTVYNIEVTDISDAVKYLTHHEGGHYSTIMHLKKIIEG